MTAIFSSADTGNCTRYWNAQNPHEFYEHWRYKEGFTTGWADCTEFSKFGNSRIGRKCAWKAARLQEHISARGNSRFIWEWEQGFELLVLDSSSNHVFNNLQISVESGT